MPVTLQLQEQKPWCTRKGKSGLLAMPRFNERLQGDGGLRNGYRKRGRDVSAISAFDAASIIEPCLPGTLECGRLSKQSENSAQSCC